MLAAIKHGLGNLVNFEGRDARQAFWFYVLFLYLVTMAIGMAVTIPMTTQAVITGVEQGIAQAQNPDAAGSDAAAEAAIAAPMSGYMPMLVWTGFATALILLLGIAASLVRRVHDSGLSGWWAALPLGLQALNVAFIPTQLGMMDKLMEAQLGGDPAATLEVYQSAFGVGAVAGWIAIIAVIVFGVRKSTPGPNRYGEAPFVA